VIGLDRLLIDLAIRLLMPPTAAGDLMHLVC